MNLLGFPLRKLGTLSKNLAIERVKQLHCLAVIISCDQIRVACFLNTAFIKFNARGKSCIRLANEKVIQIFYNFKVLLMFMLNILPNRLPIIVCYGSYYSEAYFVQPSPASMQRTCQIIEQRSIIVVWLGSKYAFAALFFVFNEKENN